MIDSYGCPDHRARLGAPPRRALEVFDDYDGGGVLSEQLADDLVNELAGLGPRARTARRRSEQGRAPAARPGPQPSRPPSGRPRLTLVRGGQT